LLRAEAELGWETSDLVVEFRLTLDGPLMPGLPVGGLSPGLELLSQTGTDRARPQGDGGSGADRNVPVPVRKRDRDRIRPGGRRKLRRHDARCNRGQAGKPERRMVLPKLYNFCSTYSPSDPPDPRTDWRPAGKS